MQSLFNSGGVHHLTSTTAKRIVVLMEWKELPGYLGYEVSDEGQVRSYRNGPHGMRATPKLLKASPAKNGYLRVSLRDGTRTKYVHVHKLVMLSFVGPDEGRQVRHRDGNPLNCRLGNLEYGNNLENAYDRQRHGNWGNALSEYTVRLMLKDLDSGEKQGSVALRYGVSQATVSKVNTGESWGWVTGRIYNGNRNTEHS